MGICPGAQTTRTDDAGPVMALLGRRASPATFFQVRIHTMPSVQAVFTPKGVVLHSPGSLRAPWGRWDVGLTTPKGLHKRPVLACPTPSGYGPFGFASPQGARGDPGLWSTTPFGVNGALFRSKPGHRSRHGRPSHVRQQVSCAGTSSTMAGQAGRTTTSRR
jgi:hypothetical protein